MELEKYCDKLWIGLKWLRTGRVFMNTPITLGLHKSKELLNVQVNNCQLLKKSLLHGTSYLVIKENMIWSPKEPATGPYPDPD